MELEAAVKQACEWMRFQRQDKDGHTVAKELEEAYAAAQPAPEPEPEG
ncbi:MAG TPA: hypothetical protein VJP77_09895 [Planctomycetota bacterium]|nr:hypothetical protein [Planctomycetota bacterium]